jgi:AAA domain
VKSQPVDESIGPASRHKWTADKLLAADFPEPRWAVPGLIPEGAALLVGAPKVGKSYLALGLGLAVAAGSRALGKIGVEPGQVLYLALEDGPRRLKGRLQMLLGEDQPPGALELWITCPKLDDGGKDRLDSWLEAHPDARLVVIDVLARMRKPASNGGSVYQADYEDMSHLKRLADKHGVAIVVVHHSRKAAAEDFVDAVSGTNGLAGAADTVLVLRRARGQADAVLYVTGRDVEEKSYALQRGAGAWELLDGTAADYTLGDTRAAILQYVRKHPRSMPKQIAVGLGCDHGLVRQTCKRMLDAGQLQVDNAGRYTSCDISDTSDRGQAASTPVTPVTDVTQGRVSRIRKRRSA